MPRSPLLPILSLVTLAAGCPGDISLDQVHIVGQSWIDEELPVGEVLRSADGCTGTLFRPNFADCAVLTAAHCVEAGYKNTFLLNDKRFTVSAYAIYSNQSPTPGYFVSRLVVLDDLATEEQDVAYLGVDVSADLAVLALESCPQQLPLELAETEPSGTEGVILVGFGQQELHSEPPNIDVPDRVDEAPIAPVERDSALRVAGANVISSNIMHQWTQTRIHGFAVEGSASDDAATTCNGDSGGPALRQADDASQPEILGVHSSGSCLVQPPQNIDQDGFRWIVPASYRFSIEVSVFDYIDWIKSPWVCMPGATRRCSGLSYAAERRCNSDGMWENSCTAVGAK